MKRIRIAFLLAAVAAVSATSAYGDGAVAVGKPANVAKNGVAVGLSTDFASAKLAGADALSQCKSSSVKASTRALCKVVKTFKGQCAAVAFDPLPGTPGFGWALGPTKFQARAAAVAACNASAGASRQGACEAIGADCD